jgi:hypothetical protein
MVVGYQMRLAGLRDIEGQLEPDVAGSGTIDTNEDVVKAHSPSPDHSSQDTLERRPPESARSAAIGKPGYANILPPGLVSFWVFERVNYRMRLPHSFYR